MAALTADFHDWRICRGTGCLSIEMAVTGADTFYRGSMGVVTLNTGTFELDNADADQYAGISEEHLVATAAGELLTVWMPRGVFWFTGVSAIATANIQDLLYCTAASDNPADLTATEAGATSAVGRCIAVEVTAVSGYIDCSDRFAVANS